MPHRLSPDDHLALQQAAQLVNEVVDRNGDIVTLQVMSILCNITHEMRLIESYLDPNGEAA